MGRGGANMAALRLGLPAGALPLDLQRLEQHLDLSLGAAAAAAAAAGNSAPAGLPHGGSAAAAAAAGRSGASEVAVRVAAAAALRGSVLGLSLEQLAQLTPGVADATSECLAESITLRGERGAAWWCGRGRCWRRRQQV